MDILRGKKAILYRRVSTTDQKNYGGSLNAQKSSLRDFCLKHQMIVVKEFQEDYSAKNFDRPEFKRLLQFAEQNMDKIDYLLIVNWDRFSRNAFEALGIIQDFKKLGIEINCIEGWIDYDDPTQLMMQLMYLGLPEVDNRIKSQKVKVGLRQGFKEGRWNRAIPFGYIPGRDEQKKPLMQVDPEKGPLLAELLKDFATGAYSQNELRTMAKYEPLRLTRSKISRVLRNEIYAGVIRVPAYKNEPEQLVNGLHQPLIDRDTYSKIQFVLDANKNFKHKKNKLDDHLPLRGFLKCTKCGRNLTGSRSTSHTGNKHSYYHCNPRKGCNERIRVKDAHLAFDDLLHDLMPGNEVAELFRLVLEDQYQSNEQSKYQQLKRIEREIVVLEERQNKLLEKLLDQVITDDVYKTHDSNLRGQLTEKQQQIADPNDHQKDLSNYIEFGVFLLGNLKTLYDSVDVSIKQKLLGSILDEKLEFQNKKYRTPKFKEGFCYIYNNINKLENSSIKKGGSLSKASRLVAGVGLEPTTFGL